MRRKWEEKDEAGRLDAREGEKGARGRLRLWRRMLRLQWRRLMVQQCASRAVRAAR